MKEINEEYIFDLREYIRIYKYTYTYNNLKHMKIYENSIRRTIYEEIDWIKKMKESKSYFTSFDKLDTLNFWEYIWDMKLSKITLSFENDDKVINISIQKENWEVKVNWYKTELI